VVKQVTAIIPAAGKGSRMGSELNKQYLKLKDKPILAHTLEVFQRTPLIDRIIVVACKEEVDFCKQHVVAKYSLDKVAAVIPGGKERVDSVRAGLDYCYPDTELVVVHDGARPLLTYNLLNQVLEKARETGAAIAAVPVKDCIKQVAGGKVEKTLDRRQLWAVQTPQAFNYVLFKKAYGTSFSDLIYDDAMVVELSGGSVSVVEGDYKNIKVTTPEDLSIAEIFLENLANKKLLGT